MYYYEMKTRVVVDGWREGRKYGTAEGKCDKPERKNGMNKNERTNMREMERETERDRQRWTTEREEVEGA